MGPHPTIIAVGGGAGIRELDGRYLCQVFSLLRVPVPRGGGQPVWRRQPTRFAPPSWPAGLLPIRSPGIFVHNVSFTVAARPTRLTVLSISLIA
jgi:hypothetical protein